MSIHWETLLSLTISTHCLSISESIPAAKLNPLLSLDLERLFSKKCQLRCLKRKSRFNKTLSSCLDMVWTHISIFCAPLPRDAFSSHFWWLPWWLFMPTTMLKRSSYSLFIQLSMISPSATMEDLLLLASRRNFYLVFLSFHARLGSLMSLILKLASWMLTLRTQSSAPSKPCGHIGIAMLQIPTKTLSQRLHVHPIWTK